MLTAAALVSVLGLAALTAAGLARLADGVDRRRLRRVHAQIRVTDSIHARLGAIVAPIVEKHTRGLWRVTMGLHPRDLGAAGSLTEISRQVLGQDGARVEVIFRPHVQVGRRPSAGDTASGRRALQTPWKDGALSH
jgi:hypothetical protein